MECLIFLVFSSQKIRFGFESGASIRIKLGATSGIRVFGSYIQTSSEGSVLQDNGDKDNPYLETDFEKSIRILNAGIGLYFEI